MDEDEPTVYLDTSTTPEPPETVSGCCRDRETNVERIVPIPDTGGHVSANPCPSDRMVALEGIRALLRLVGDDPHRDGLTDTPRRVVDALVASCDRTGIPGPEELMSRTFDTTTRPDQMIAIGPITFATLCEHHLLPFSGTAWIAYLPVEAKVVGLSKFGRLVDWHAQGLQVQERLTEDITDSIVKYAGIESTACLIRSQHACMTTRGVRKTGAHMVTSDLRGAFRDNPETRAEFLAFTRS